MAAAGRSGAAADGSRNPPSWVAAAWTDSAARATGPPPPAGASSHSSTTSRPSTAVAVSGLLLAVGERIVKRKDTAGQRPPPGVSRWRCDRLLSGDAVRHCPRAGGAVSGQGGQPGPVKVWGRDSIRVLYDPANPRNARLDTWVSRRGDSLTMVAIGLGLVVWVRWACGCFDRRGEPLDVQQQNRPAQDAEGRAAGWPPRHVDHHRDQDRGGGVGPRPVP
jgi:hypothetical protein